MKEFSENVKATATYSLLLLSEDQGRKKMLKKISDLYQELECLDEDDCDNYNKIVTEAVSVCRDIVKLQDEIDGHLDEIKYYSSKAENEVKLDAQMILNQTLKKG